MKNGTASVAVEPQKCSSSRFHLDGVIAHLCDLHNAFPPCECRRACVVGTVLRCIARHCSLVYSDWCIDADAAIAIASCESTVNCWHWHWIHRLHIVLPILQYYIMCPAISCCCCPFSKIEHGAMYINHRLMVQHCMAKGCSTMHCNVL